MVQKIEVPSDSLKNVETLCSINKPYEQTLEQDKLFISAMKEVLLWHHKKSDFVQKLFAQNNFAPEHLGSVDDLEKIPTIFANFFKYHEIKSVADSDVYLHLTSSGTTGQKSQMFFDFWTIKSAQRMVEFIFDHYGWITPSQKCNYLLYTYEPEEQSKLGTAYTDNFLCSFAPINSCFYSLRLFNGSEHKFDLFGTIDTLKKFEADGLPVRILGFPSFLYFTLQELDRRDISLKLSPDSLVFLGGGWKGAQNQAISKQDLYSLATKRLGIPDHRLRDGFGSVEHCVPYVECEHHNFHIPVWSKVIVRDVLSLNNIGYGQIGYLNFISPYITSVPANSVMMGDLVTLHKHAECGCSTKTDFFKIVGRAGTSATKSCAISAAELMKEYSR